MSTQHVIVKILVLLMLQCVSSIEIYASFKDESDERAKPSQLQLNLIESYYPTEASPSKPIVFTPPVTPSFGRFAFFTSWFRPQWFGSNQETQKLTVSTFLIIELKPEAPAFEPIPSMPVGKTKVEVKERDGVSHKPPVFEVFSLKECALLSVYLPPNVTAAERAEILTLYRSYKAQFRNSQKVCLGAANLFQGFSWRAINTAKLAFAAVQLKRQSAIEPNQFTRNIIDAAVESKFSSRSERRKAQLLSVHHYIDYQWDKRSYDCAWQRLSHVKTSVMPDEDLVWSLLFEVSLLRERSPFPTMQILPRMRQLSKFLPNEDEKSNKYLLKMTKEQQAWFWLWSVELFMKGADSAIPTEYDAAFRLNLMSPYFSGYRVDLALLYSTLLHIRYKFDSSLDSEVYNDLDQLEASNNLKFKTHYLPLVRLLKADMHINNRASVLSDAEVDVMLGSLRDASLFQDRSDYDYARLLFLTLQVDSRVRGFSGDHLFDALAALMPSSLSFYEKLKLPLFMLRLVAEQRTNKLDLRSANVLADKIRNGYASNREIRFFAIAAKAKIVAALCGFQNDLEGNIKMLLLAHIETQLKKMVAFLPPNHPEKIALQLCRCRLFIDRFEPSINCSEVYQILYGVIANPIATPEHRTEATILTLEQRSSS